MKFLIFNIAILGALYYLFNTNVKDTRDMANMANQAIGRIKILASSTVARTREFSSKRTNLKETTPPVFEPKPPAPRIVSSSVVADPPSPPEPVEMLAEKPGSAETPVAIPVKSPGERRRELLDMAQNMELLYLRKAGE